MWTNESLCHPLGERVERAQGGDAFVLNRGEDGATDQNLATRVALPFGVVRAGNQARTFRSQSRETSVERLDARTG